MFSPLSVCLLLCLFVSRITRKQLSREKTTLVEGCGIWVREEPIEVGVEPHLGLDLEMMYCFL